MASQLSPYVSPLFLFSEEKLYHILQRVYFLKVNVHWTHKFSVLYFMNVDIKICTYACMYLMYFRQQLNDSCKIGETRAWFMKLGVHAICESVVSNLIISLRKVYSCRVLWHPFTASTRNRSKQELALRVISSVSRFYVTKSLCQ